jgi:D-lactate dehydrogenase
MSIHSELEKIFTKNRVKTSLIDRVSFASDAGFYKLIPKAIVQPIDTKEIKQLFSLCTQTNTPLVFRTGGTSLSGQSITDGILVDLSRYLRKIEIKNQGESIIVQPGVIGAIANAHLKKFNRKIGPDPSSINSAMMGGILSNNSSGMCCGVEHNAFHTLKNIQFVLTDGTLFDTRIEADYQKFASHPIGKGIASLKKEFDQNQTLVQKVLQKYTNIL